METALSKEVKGIIAEDTQKKVEAEKEFRKKQELLIERRFARLVNEMNLSAEKAIGQLAMIDKKQRDKERKEIADHYLNIFNTKLSSAKDVIQKNFDKQFEELIHRDEARMEEARKKLAQEYHKLFEAKLMTSEKEADKQIDLKLKKRFLEEDQKRAGIEEKMQKNIEKLTAHYKDLFDKRLNNVEEKMLNSTGEKFNLFAQNCTEKQKILSQKRKKAWDEFVSKQLSLFDTKLAKVADQLKEATSEMAKKQETLVKQENAKTRQEFNKKLASLSGAETARRKLDEAKRAQDVEELTAHMLRIIEARLDVPEAYASDKDSEEFEILFNKLRGMKRVSAKHLKALDKRLAFMKKQNMEQGKTKGGGISQREIDAIVKHEVNRQLRQLKLRRDPRADRMKKVVALEKMRNLIQGLDD